MLNEPDWACETTEDGHLHCEIKKDAGERAFSQGFKTAGEVGTTLAATPVAFEPNITSAAVTGAFAGSAYRELTRTDTKTYIR